MAVSFIEPMMIQVMDLAGNVLNTISEDDKGTPVFSKPYYISVSIEDTGDMVHVSN